MKKYIRSSIGDLSLQLFSDAREILDYFEWHNRNLNKRQEEILSDLSDAVDSGSTIAVREAIGNLKFNSKNFTNEQYYIVMDLYNELCTSGGKYESIGRYNDIQSSISIKCSKVMDFAEHRVTKDDVSDSDWDQLQHTVNFDYYDSLQKMAQDLVNVIEDDQVWSEVEWNIFHAWYDEKGFTDDDWDYVESCGYEKDQFDHDSIESSTSIECSEYTSENPLLVECLRGPYYVWEEFGTFKGSVNNPNSRIVDARRIQTFDGFDTIDEVIDYVKRYF